MTASRARLSGPWWSQCLPGARHERREEEPVQTSQYRNVIHKKDANLTELNRQWKDIENEFGLNEDPFAKLDSLPLVEGPRFNLLMSAVVLLNSVCMGMELDMTDDTMTFEDKIFPWYTLDVVFNAVYLGEVALRWCTRGVRLYFESVGNWMDFGIVMLSCVDTFLVTPLAGAGSGLKSLAALRILRLFRLVRLMRLLTFFHELLLICLGMYNASKTLSWVALLLSICLYFVGVCATTLIGKECNSDFADWDRCYELYGTVYRSMYSMWQMTTWESWSQVLARPVLEEKPWLIFLFVPLQFVTTLGLLNVVVGVIVESTMAASKSEDSKVREAKRRNLQFLLKSLKRLFELINDGDDDEVKPVLTCDEFCAVYFDSALQHKFEALDLPTDREPIDVFRTLDPDGDNEVTIQEFVRRCQRLRGPAQAKDMMECVANMRKLAHDSQSLSATLSICKGAMESLVHGYDSICGTLEEVAQEMESAAAETPSPPAPVGPGSLSSAAQVDLKLLRSLSKQILALPDIPQTKAPGACAPVFAACSMY